MKAPLINNDIKYALEKRITGELKAELMYRTLSAKMQYEGYFGTAEYFAKEAVNEASHAQKLINFCNDMGVLPSIESYPNPIESGDTLKDVFKQAFDAEYDLYEAYSQLYKGMGDPIVSQFLLFFLEEQRTAVGEYGDFLATLEQCGDDKGALLLFDKNLG